MWSPYIIPLIIIVCSRSDTGIEVTLHLSLAGMEVMMLYALQVEMLCLFVEVESIINSAKQHLTLVMLTSLPVT